MSRLRLNYVLIVLSLVLGAGGAFAPPLPAWLVRALGLLCFACVAWVVLDLRPARLAAAQEPVRQEARRQVRVLLAIGCAGLLGGAEILLSDTGLDEIVPLVNLAGWALAVAAFVGAVHGLRRLPPGRRPGS